MKRMFAWFRLDGWGGLQHVINSAEALGYEWHLKDGCGLEVIAPESFWDVMAANSVTVPTINDIN